MSAKTKMKIEHRDGKIRAIASRGDLSVASSWWYAQDGSAEEEAYKWLAKAEAEAEKAAKPVPVSPLLTWPTMTDGWRVIGGLGGGPDPARWQEVIAARVEDGLGVVVTWSRFGVDGVWCLDGYGTCQDHTGRNLLKPDTGLPLEPPFEVTP